ncbi:MAG TPA: cell division protein [Sutterella sp.]|nr:cell division protein [Sutterella sp.]
MKPSVFLSLIQTAYQQFKREDAQPRKPLREDNPEKAWRMLQASERRSHIALCTIVVMLLACLVKIADLQIFQSSDIEANGQQFYRYAVTRNLPAKRGQILDRQGNVLANSELCHTIWASPEKVIASGKKAVLAGALKISTKELDKRMAVKRRNVIVGKCVDDRTTTAIRSLKIDGMTFENEYKRIYPGGAISAHVVGLVGSDGNGLEGVECFANQALAGRDGRRGVLRIPGGKVLEELWRQESEEGTSLTLSIDSRIQTIAVEALQKTVARHEATSGSAIVVDVRNGEVLALASWPSYNPNVRSQLNYDSVRNRVVTDMFEPGSTMKPFAIAKALDMGIVKPDTAISTHPGKILVEDQIIGDDHDYGVLSVAEVIAKSSNVGTVRIALQLPSQTLWKTYSELGFGQKPEVQIPGATSGKLRPAQRWGVVEHATIAYGYGVSVSLAQLARAYTAFAREGDVVPLTLFKTDRERVAGKPVFTPETAKEMLKMMRLTVLAGGTASRLKIDGYTNAGKTGTAYKVKNGAYDKNVYVGSFVGIAPMTRPRIVTAVMIDEPKRDGHVGGVVATPVYKEIVERALNVLNVPSDELTRLSDNFRKP